MSALHNVNQLLEAHLDDIVKAFPNANAIIDARLAENKERFACRAEGARTETEFNLLLREKVLRIETSLQKLPIWKPLHEKEGLKNTVRHIYSLCPEELKRGLFLKETVAADILHDMPPVQMLAHVPKSKMRALSPLSILSITRFTETKEWQDAYLARLGTLSARHFIERNIRCLVIDSETFSGVLKLAGEKQKPWRISHSKETGIISCFTLDPEHRLLAPLTQYISVFMHYFFETAFSSQATQSHGAQYPERIGEYLRKIIKSHTQKFDFFQPNAYSEHFFWERAIDLFVASFPDIEELQFFNSTVDCGGYMGDTVVSLNLIDHIWNVNLLGQDATKAYFGDARGSFLYHFREGLWYDLFRLMLRLTKEEMQDTTMHHLHTGDKPFTSKMIKKFT